MDYSGKNKMELISLCKEKQIKGYSGRNKHEIISLLSLQGVESTEEKNMNNPTHNPNNQPVNKVYRVISLFSGMGGMDVGFGEQVTVHKNSIQCDDYIERE
jgi:hypothetical protein